MMDGRTLDEGRALWAQVKEELRRRDACAGHDFGPFPNPMKLGHKHKCLHCGCEISTYDRTWYERGRADAGNPSPHWTELQAMKAETTAGEK